MAAMIILPGASARFWTNRLGRLLTIAAVLGAAAGAAGTLLASPHALLGFDPLGFGDAHRTLPPGPLIVLSATAFFLVSLFFAPRRGIASITISELRLRSRMVREHLLRALFELSEPRLPTRPVISETDVMAYRHWNRWLVDWWLRSAARKGLVNRRPDGIQLTEAGLAAAAEVTKTHRLWELFLVEQANVAADHVDRDADDVEHLLPTPVIADLEDQLVQAGEMPPAGEVIPDSPHELPTE